MPIASGINHIATLTTDIDLTVGFYEQVFDAVVTHVSGRRLLSCPGVAGSPRRCA